MFRFTLVKDLPFRMTTYSTSMDICGMRRWRSMIISGVTIEWEDKSECKELSELKELVDGYYRATESQWRLKTDVGIDTSPNLSRRDFIRVVVDSRYKDVLAGLKKVLSDHGWQLKMSVEIRDFGGEWSDGVKVQVVTEEESIIELSPVRFESDLLLFFGVLEISLWELRTGIITINCFAYRSKECLPKVKEPCSEGGPMSSFILQKMLHDGLYSDATVISKEGEEIKCHQSILNYKSDVLKTMLKDTSNSTTSIPGVIKMDEMCSKSVLAFLAYLYLEDIEQALGDCRVAFDLLQAAHKYLLPKLEGKMKQLLSCKPQEWFNVEVAMRLYFFVKNLEDADELKRKTLRIMKKNYAALNDLPAYIQLVEKEPHSARQLFADLMGMK